jgi:hypothetical protein
VSRGRVSLRPVDYVFCSRHHLVFQSCGNNVALTCCPPFQGLQIIMLRALREAQSRHIPLWESQAALKADWGAALEEATAL